MIRSSLIITPPPPRAAARRKPSDFELKSVVEFIEKLKASTDRALDRPCDRADCSGGYLHDRDRARRIAGRRGGRAGSNSDRALFESADS
jgi:hypothetical protein